MKDNLTEIVAIIDASGSMQPFVNDTIGGFNKFLEEQKTLDGEANITFSIDGILMPVENVPKLATMIASFSCSHI